MNAANSDCAALLARHRLWILMGKGGTGRTTLCAALGVLAVRAGLRALVVAPAAEEAMGALLDAPPATRGDPDPIDVGAGLELLRIDPQWMLGAYLEQELPLGRLGRRLLESESVQPFLEAAPGWRDLVTLGKIWSLEQERSRQGRPRYDVILVDAPATGHGLSFLSIPRVVLDAVGSGPVRRQSEELQRMLVDRERTVCVPVTLAEELPVRETAQLLEGLDDLGIGVGPLCVNRLEPPCSLDPAELVPRLRALDAAAAPPLAQPALLLEALEQRAGRARAQQHWLRALPIRAGSARIRVPYLVDPIQSRGGVERLADALGAAWLEAAA